MGIVVTKDEADKTQFDGLAVENKKPGFRYRWSRKKDTAIAMHKFHGYESVDGSKPDSERSALDDSTRMKKDSGTSTSVEVGDMVLMRIPEEKYKALNERRLDKIKRMEQSTASEFKRQVRRAAPHGEDLGFIDNSDSSERRKE